jgi:predicted transcriptional regulator
MANLIRREISEKIDKVIRDLEDIKKEVEDIEDDDEGQPKSDDPTAKPPKSL